MIERPQRAGTRRCGPRYGHTGSTYALCAARFESGESVSLGRLSRAYSSAPVLMSGPMLLTLSVTEPLSRATCMQAP